MTALIWLVPIVLAMGIVALLAFLWSMRSNQYEDLDGAAERVLLDRQEDRPIVERPARDRPDRDRTARDQPDDRGEPGKP
ncbi:MAG TPA: cbb3-type cytochrome oxidase assembly protein CcoS [Thalassobaculum sp.]